MRFLESFPNVEIINETITLSNSFNDRSNDLIKQVVNISQ